MFVCVYCIHTQVQYTRVQAILAANNTSPYHHHLKGCGSHSVSCFLIPICAPTQSNIFGSIRLTLHVSASNAKSFLSFCLVFTAFRRLTVAQTIRRVSERAVVGGGIGGATQDGTVGGKQRRVDLSAGGKAKLHLGTMTMPQKAPN